MVRVLKENEALMQVGTMGMKQEDGTIVSVPLYRVVLCSEQMQDDTVQRAGEIFAEAYRNARVAV